MRPASMNGTTEPRLRTMNPQLEALTKAIQCADLLAGDVREAHRLACQDNPLLEPTLMAPNAEMCHIILT